MEYTVIVRFYDEEDPTSFDTYVCWTNADNPHLAGGNVIDTLIEERGIDPEEEEDMDIWRVDYRCIAIYEGHLTNLVQ